MNRRQAKIIALKVAVGVLGSIDDLPGENDSERDRVKREYDAIVYRLWERSEILHDRDVAERRERRRVADA